MSRYKDTTFYYTARPLIVVHSEMKSSAKRAAVLLCVFEMGTVRGLHRVLSQFSFSVPTSPTWSLSPAQQGQAVIYSLHLHLQVSTWDMWAPYLKESMEFSHLKSIDRPLTLPKPQSFLFPPSCICVFLFQPVSGWFGLDSLRVSEHAIHALILSGAGFAVSLSLSATYSGLETVWRSLSQTASQGYAKCWLRQPSGISFSGSWRKKKNKTLLLLFVAASETSSCWPLTVPDHLCDTEQVTLLS